MAVSGLAAFYRTYAARCVEMSRETPDVAGRFTLLGMAQAWLMLADQAETREPLGPGLSTVIMPEDGGHL